MLAPPLSASFDDAAVACCSEDFTTAGLLAHWQPRIVLQTLGGLIDPDDPSVAATVSYAFDYLRLGRLIIVTHDGCAADARPADECRRALRESPLVRRVRRRGVVVHAVASSKLAAALAAARSAPEAALEHLGPHLAAGGDLFGEAHALPPAGRRRAPAERARRRPAEAPQRPPRARPGPPSDGLGANVVLETAPRAPGPAPPQRPATVTRRPGSSPPTHEYAGAWRVASLHQR